MRALLFAGFILIAAGTGLVCESGRVCSTTASSYGTGDQILVITGSGATTRVYPYQPKPKGSDTMEAVGILATVFLTLGGIFGALLLALWVCDNLKYLKKRVAALELLGDVTDREIESVMASTTKEEALDAIIALRSK